MKTDFKGLGINSRLIDALEEEGITTPTPIQRDTIPLLLEGLDVIGQAQTGTGKTFAFILPIMERIDTNKKYIQAIIVTPTRELALQITKEAKKMATPLGVKTLAAYGGQDVLAQVRRLKDGIHLVIGTPGRLLDHIRRGTLILSKTSMVVLDEADIMLDMGFIKEVEDIINTTSEERQMMLFSATMPEGIKDLAKKYMRSPKEIQVKGKGVTLEEIKQYIVEISDRQKQRALFNNLKELQPYMGIIFCRTKRRAKALNEALQLQGYSSDELHGDLTQAKREKVMDTFRRGKIQLLVATDVVARGIDVEGITHIFNYDVPQDIEGYIHRIGRTGRAGEVGMAITFATPRDNSFIKDLEATIGFRIKRREVAFEVDNPPKSKGPKTKNRHQEIDKDKKRDKKEYSHDYKSDSSKDKKDRGRDNKKGKEKSNKKYGEKNDKVNDFSNRDKGTNPKKKTNFKQHVKTNREDSKEFIGTRESKGEFNKNKTNKKNNKKDNPRRPERNKKK